MLYGFLVLDPHKFTLFEYFPDRTKANMVMEQINEVQELEGKHTSKEFEFVMQKFNEEFAYCVVYSPDEKLNPEIKDNLKEIAANVMKGDKVSLRQVLSSDKLSDFESIF